MLHQTVCAVSYQKYQVVVQSIVILIQKLLLERSEKSLQLDPYMETHDKVIHTLCWKCECYKIDKKLVSTSTLAFPSDKQASVVR